MPIAQKLENQLRSKILSAGLTAYFVGPTDARSLQLIADLQSNGVNLVVKSIIQTPIMSDRGVLILNGDDEWIKQEDFVQKIRKAGTIKYILGLIPLVDGIENFTLTRTKLRDTDGVANIFEWKREKVYV